MTAEDIKELAKAKKLLENPGLAIKISDYIGSPIEKGLNFLPANWKDKVGKATQRALTKSLEASLRTLNTHKALPPRKKLHTLGTAMSGGIGGFFGFSALLLELPVSTTIMLRSIADIARSRGEHIEGLEAKLACMEVFTMGGRSHADDGAETSYFAMRSTLSNALGSLGQQIIADGIKQSSNNLIIKFIAKIAERFGLQVTQKVAAQAIPVIGAVGGAAINTIFINHYQQMGTGHFIVRQLSRKYPEDTVRAMYEKL